MFFMKTLIRFFVVVIILAFGLGFLAYVFLGPVGDKAETQVFVVPEDTLRFDVARSLSDSGLIKNPGAFQFLLNNFVAGKEIKSGGYRLNQRMNAWEIMNKITGKPDLFWVTISFCARKEQIGEKFEIPAFLRKIR